MSESALQQQVQVRQGAYLPHWTLDGAIYHVVFRLADSLPAAVLAEFRAERDALRAAAAEKRMDRQVLEANLRALFSEKVESVLDRGLGDCWLARDDIAALTAKALLHFEGSRYTLHAWCVMPNHVHAIVQPKASHGLPILLKSWKGFTALEANRLLSRTGEFWQPEYYDHLIRNEAELAQAVQYVQDNPRRAGLPDWRWMWPPAV